jgi:hypothetical protein
MVMKRLGIGAWLFGRRRHRTAQSEQSAGSPAPSATQPSGSDRLYVLETVDRKGGWKPEPSWGVPEGELHWLGIPEAEAELALGEAERNGLIEHKIDEYWIVWWLTDAGKAEMQRLKAAQQR